MQYSLKALKSLSICLGLCLGLTLATNSVAMAAEESFKAVAKSLMHHVAQNLLPKESAKAVRKEGAGYVAYYNSVNPNEYTTEIRDSQGNDKIGFVRYKQYEHLCYGATKAEALKAPCKVTARSMTELIAYHQGKWIFQLMQ